jgi:hypothetical protein
MRQVKPVMVSVKKTRENSLAEAPVITSRIRWLYGFGSIAYGVKEFRSLK